MRHGNLPDESHDRIAQKRNRDLITRRHKNITQRHGGDISQWHFWVFHLRLTREVVETYQWDVSVMYHWKVAGCFIWDLFETLWRHWWDFVMSYHWWDIEMLWRHTTETLGDAPLRRCVMFHLRHTCSIPDTYKEMLLCCHNILLPCG